MRRGALGRVYFISAPELDLIKIGWANNPILRLNAIRLLSPIKLDLIGHAAGGEGLERRLHARFAAQRKHGEWFHRTPDLEAAIQAAIAGLEIEAGSEAAKERPLPDRSVPAPPRLSTDELIAQLTAELMQDEFGRRQLARHNLLPRTQ